MPVIWKQVRKQKTIEIRDFHVSVIHSLHLADDFFFFLFPTSSHSECVVTQLIWMVHVATRATPVAPGT